MLISKTVYAGDVIVENGKLDVDTKLYVDSDGNSIVQKNNEVYLNIKNTETNGRQYALVSAGSLGGIGIGKFSIYDKTAGTSRLTIDTSGNVGIGTTSPGSKLTIYDNTAGDVAFLKLQHATNYGANLGVNTDVTGDFFIQTVIAGTATKRLTIQRADGNVGIGTTSPSYKLDVNGNSRLLANGFGGVTLEQLAYPNQGALIFSTDRTGYTLQIGNRRLSDSNYLPIISMYDSGNVGIGTTSPSQKLDVAGYVKGQTGLCIGNDCKTAWSQVGGGQWVTNGNNIYNSNSGNVGIGTTSPSYKLHVTGGTIASTGYLPLTANWATYGTGDGGAAIYNDAGSYQALMIVGADRGQGYARWVRIWDSLWVSSRIDAPAFYYTSDERLKKDFAPVNGLDVITKLNGISFTWKNTGERSAGLTAQDVEKVLPEAVSTDNTTGMKSLNYGALTAPIIESIKELDNKTIENEKSIDELRQEIISLKKEIDELKSKR